MKKVGIGFLINFLMTIQSLSAIPTANAAGPSTGTAVTWTNDTFFNAYTSQSGVTTSDKNPTNSLVWQPFYSHAPLTIPADGVSRLGINTYQSGSNTVTYRIAISTADDTPGSFGAEQQFSSQSFSYSAGGFNQQTVSTGVTIPANRYFLIGVYNGPYYRAIKSLAANRTAQISGVNYVTALNTVFYVPHGSSVYSGIPIDLGGSSSSFTTYTGFVSVISVKFKATGSPPLPALSAPSPPTVTSITGSSVIFSNPELVSNAQSYVVSLYTSNGTTLVETRTATNAQVTAGFSWGGLSPNTNYNVGFTAVGDGSNFSNSAVSGLQAFTTNLGATSILLSAPSSTALFNTATNVTASITGWTTGKITFYARGKRIPGCISMSVSGLSKVCSWKPKFRGGLTVSAVYSPSSASYVGSSAQISFTVTNRNSPR